MPLEVAVIGLGSMGIGMAQSLIRDGHRVSGFDLRAESRQALVSFGGQAATSAIKAVTAVKAVVSVVVNADQTEDLLFGPSGIASVLEKGSVFISCATMSPQHARSLAGRVEALGLLYLDAPISGGSAKAASGDLTIITSGDDEAYDAAAPLLDTMAARIFRIGSKPGEAAAMKMVNQLLAGTHIAVASEAMVLGARLGLDMRKVYEVITASAGNSWMFEDRMPHVIEGNYQPLSSVEIFVKDLGIINDMSRQLRYPSPLAAAALQIYLAASGSGLGSEDDSAVAKIYASLAGIDLPAKEA